MLSLILALALAVPIGVADVADTDDIGFLICYGRCFKSPHERSYIQYADDGRYDFLRYWQPEPSCTMIFHQGMYVGGDC